MKENILMRILLCNIHCPFICSCKPSAAARLCAAASGPSPLRLENAPPLTAPCRVVCVSDSSDQSFEDAKEDDSSNNGGLKSCIKKEEEATGTDKKRVEWVDSVGQQLAEIREFESSESGDTDCEEEENQSLCVSLCTIL